MRQLICFMMTVCFIGTCLAGGSVNLLIWGQYTNPKTIPIFEQQTGIHVNQSYYDSADMLRGILMTGNNGYDVALPALVDMPQLIKAKLLLPIDKAQIPNYKHLNPALLKKTAMLDPDNRYGIIYQWGTTGIAYNVKKIRQILGPNAPTDRWDLLLNPLYLDKLRQCGVDFLDDPQAVFGTTLHYLGLNPNTTNPADYRKATAHLMRLRQDITSFNNFTYINDLANGNVCIAMGYSGDVLRAIEAAKAANDKVQLRYVIPKSGAQIWFDMLVIPVGAPNYNNALRLLNFFLSARVSAWNSNFNFQPNGVADSRPYLLAQLKQPNVTPDQQVIKKLFVIHHAPHSIAALYNQLWFKVRYGFDFNME